MIIINRAKNLHSTKPHVQQKKGFTQSEEDTDLNAEFETNSSFHPRKIDSASCSQDYSKKKGFLNTLCVGDTQTPSSFCSFLNQDQKISPQRTIISNPLGKHPEDLIKFQDYLAALHTLISDYRGEKKDHSEPIQAPKNSPVTLKTLSKFRHQRSISSLTNQAKGCANLNTQSTEMGEAKQIKRNLVRTPSLSLRCEEFDQPLLPCLKSIKEKIKKRFEFKMERKAHQPNQDIKDELFKEAVAEYPYPSKKEHAAKGLAIEINNDNNQKQGNVWEELLGNLTNKTFKEMPHNVIQELQSFCESFELEDEKENKKAFGNVKFSPIKARINYEDDAREEEHENKAKNQGDKGMKKLPVMHRSIMRRENINKKKVYNGPNIYEFASDNGMNKELYYNAKKVITDEESGLLERASFAFTKEDQKISLETPTSSLRELNNLDHAEIPLSPQKLKFKEASHLRRTKSLSDRRNKKREEFYAGINSLALQKPKNREQMERFLGRVQGLTDYYYNQPIISFGTAECTSRNIVFENSGQYILYGRDRSMKLYDSLTGFEIRTYIYEGAKSLASCTTVGFTADNLEVIAGYSNGILRKFDFQTGALVRSYENEDSEEILDLKCTSDGQYLITNSIREILVFYETTWELKRKFDLWNPGQCASLAVSSTRNFKIAFPSTEKKISIYNLDDFSELSAIHTESCSSTIVFSSEDERLIIGDHNGDIAVYYFYLEERKYILKNQLNAHNKPILILCFSRDCKRLLTSDSEKIIIWAINGEAISKLNVFEPEKTICFSSFHPDSIKTVVSYHDHSLSLLVSTDFNCFLNTFGGHTGVVKAVAFSPDGSKVISGSTDKTAKLYDTLSGIEINTFSSPGPVCSLSFNPTGSKILIGCETGALLIYSVLSYELLKNLEQAHQGSVLTTCFSNFDIYILTGSSDKTMKLFSSANFELIRVFSGYYMSVNSVCFNPNNSTVLSGCQDGTVKLHDISTGTEVLSFLGHTDSVQSVKFSPDGTKILTGSMDRTVRIYDTTTSSEIMCLNQHSAGVTSVVFGQNGLKILSGGEDGCAFVYDCLTGDVLRSFITDAGVINSVSFSPDSTKILTGNNDRTMKLYDAQTSAETRNFSVQVGSIDCVAFSPNGTKVLSGSSSGTMKLTDVFSGEELRTFSGHTGSVRSVAFSPDGDKLLSGSYDGLVKIYNVSTGLETKTFYSHQASVNSVAFSSDGSKFLSGGSDKTIRLYDALTLKETKCFNLHNDVINCAVFSPSNDMILSVGDSSSVKIFDVNHNIDVINFLGHSKAVLSAAFSPDGVYILTGSRDCTMRLFEVVSGNEEFCYSGHSQAVIAVLFSPDGYIAISGSLDGTMRLYKVESGKLIRSIKAHYSHPLSSLAFSPDGSKLLSGSYFGTMMLHNTVTGEELKDFTCPYPNINSISLSPDSTKIAVSANLQKNIKIYSTLSGEELRTLLGHEATVNALCFSPEGGSVLSGSSDQKLCLFDIASGRQSKIYKGNTSTILAVAFRSDGRNVLSGAADGSIIMFDSETANIIRTFVGNIGEIRAICFSHSDKYIVSGGADRIMRVFETETGAELFTFFGHTDTILTVAVSKDGGKIASGGADRTMRMYDFYTRSEIRVTNCPSFVHTLKFSDDGTKILTATKLFDVLTGSDLRTLSNYLGNVNVAAFDFEKDIFVLGCTIGLTIGFNLINDFNHLYNVFQTLKNTARSIVISNSSAMNDQLILPFPLKMNKVQYSIFRYGENKTVDLEAMLKKILERVELPEFLYSLINQEDSFGLSSWDYCNRFTTNKKGPILSLLIDHHVLCPNKSRRFSANTKNLDSLFEMVSRYFPSKLPQFLESFCLDTEMTLTLCNTNNPVPPLLGDFSWPNKQYIEDLYYKSMGKDESLSHYDLKAKIFLFMPKPESLFMYNIGRLPPNHPIFKSEPLIYILEERWLSNTQSIFRKEFIKYLGFLAVLTYYITTLYPEKMDLLTSSECGLDSYHKRLSIAFDVMLLFYLFYFVYKVYRNIVYTNPGLLETQAKTVKRSVLNYLSNSRDLLELFMVLSGVSALGCDLFYTITEPDNNIFTYALKINTAFFFFFSWIRVLGFARGFRITSALIRLLHRVFEDMIGFLVVLFFTLIGVGLTSFILQNSYEVNTPWIYIKTFYYILYGNFDDFIEMSSSSGLGSDLYFLILVPISVFLVVIMLNLLIAIISDSFEKVMALEKQAATYERLQIIIETEKTMSNSNKNKRSNQIRGKYIYILENDSLHLSEDVEERLRYKIDELRKNQETLRKEMKEEIKRNHEIWRKTHSRLNEDLKKNSEKGQDDLKRDLKDELHRRNQDQVEQLKTIIKSSFDLFTRKTIVSMDSIVEKNQF